MSDIHELLTIVEFQQRYTIKVVYDGYGRREVRLIDEVGGEVLYNGSSMETAVAHLNTAHTIVGSIVRQLHDAIQDHENTPSEMSSHLNGCDNPIASAPALDPARAPTRHDWSMTSISASFNDFQYGEAEMDAIAFSGGVGTVTQADWDKVVAAKTGGNE
jgi:hypothetical protein